MKTTKLLFQAISMIFLILFNLAGCAVPRNYWEEARRQDDLLAYRDYLDKVPNGVHSTEAKSRINKFLEEEWQKLRTDNSPKVKSLLDFADMCLLYAYSGYADINFSKPISNDAKDMAMRLLPTEYSGCDVSPPPGFAKFASGNYSITINGINYSRYNYLKARFMGQEGYFQLLQYDSGECFGTEGSPAERVLSNAGRITTH